MTRQTARPLGHIKLSARNEPIEQLARQAEKGSLILDPPYQRQDVWTLDQRVALLHSAMTGVPIPSIVCNTRDGGRTRTVVDGKQRVTTFRMLFSGDILLPATWFEPGEVSEDGVIDLVEGDPLADTYGDTGPYVSYLGLTENGRAAFDTITIVVANGHLRTTEEEAAVYVAINLLGTPQTNEEIANARRIAGR